mgnify:CR=1 FL=1
MPTYSYQCKNCGDETQLYQSMNDDPITECVTCLSKSSLVRIISGGTGLIFKGSGFYKTDYVENKNDETNKSKKQKENKKKG